ncbi:hypothetical protein V6N13_123606 [Hibiscus sabdariffa]|uniref:Uncharacterized protein n=1 Tax=Hibiscus sabdariffa TaxID=183260 RepID=A0ABR2QTX4_9ROSI
MDVENRNGLGNSNVVATLAADDVAPSNKKGRSLVESESDVPMGDEVLAHTGVFEGVHAVVPSSKVGDDETGEGSR